MQEVVFKRQQPRRLIRAVWQAILQGPRDWIKQDEFGCERRREVREEIIQEDEFGGQGGYAGDPVEHGGLEEVRRALEDVDGRGGGLLVFGKVPTGNPIGRGSFHGKERQSACSPFDLELTQVELE